MEHHFQLSSYREKTLEHVFVGECLKALWRQGIYDIEILRAEVDAAGYDLVFELRGLVRHIQLKSSHSSGRAARQTLNGKLCLKPSGCAIWIVFDADTLALGPFYWFGNGPGKKLYDLNDIPKAKHTRANSQGIKLERQNSYSVPRARFQRLATIDEVLTRLFGKAVTS